MGMFNKETDFFKLFEIGMGYSLNAARELRDAFPGGEVNEEKLKSIKAIEHQADKHVHHCLDLVEESFITPIDRSDILEIVKGIEDITDSVHSIANNIYILNITSVNDQILKFIDLIVKACEGLSSITAELKQFKKNYKSIHELNTEVNRIEEEGDGLFMQEMHRLFSRNNTMEVVDIIRRKELLYSLESCLDRCEDVADAIEKIIVAKT